MPMPHRWRTHEDPRTHRVNNLQDRVSLVKGSNLHLNRATRVRDSLARAFSHPRDAAHPVMDGQVRDSSPHRDRATQVKESPDRAFSHRQDEADQARASTRRAGVNRGEGPRTAQGGPAPGIRKVNLTMVPTGDRIQK